MPTSFLYFILNIITTDPLVPFILAITLGVLGLILFVIYRDKLNADKKSSSWSSVPGKITSSRIEKRSSFDWHDNRRYTRYVPAIKYSYTVEGNPYQAERIGNGIYIGMTRNAVSHWTKRFPTGTTLPVYYNPADPSDAVLEPTSNSNIIGFGVGLVIDVLAIFFVVDWLYRVLIRH